MDEPLSNLDAKLRVFARAELKRLHKKLGITFIYVTHDQIEALSMGTRIAILNKGKIEQVGEPDIIYNSPKNLFVAGFIGSPPMNMLDRAQAAIQEGDVEKAVENYIMLINQKIEIEAVIEDLKVAVNASPESPILWQTLGDAYMQDGQITEAINAYRKGMEAV